MAKLTFESNPKHRSKKRGRVSSQPTNGQTALDNSVQISERSTRRVGVLMQHLTGIFYGFVVEWNELERGVQRQLQALGLVTSRGRILSVKS